MPSTVTFTSACDRGRLYLWLFCAYAVIAGSSLLWCPSFILEFPLLGPIERLTGLPHLATPSTPEEQRFVSLTGMFATAIGLIYGLEVGPYWNYGGKVFVQASMDGRLIFSVMVVVVCFFTTHGSSCLFLIGITDAIFALFTQWMVGGRKSLYGIIEGQVNLSESEDEGPSSAKGFKRKSGH